MFGQNDVDNSFSQGLLDGVADGIAQCKRDPSACDLFSQSQLDLAKADTIEATMRALADPTRLRIMRLLSAMELAVGELAQVLGQSQPRVSRHIGILCDASLPRAGVTSTRPFSN